ncbi:helix-turn-helix transcriptional regulator [Streptomyces hydrogenans]|uniref:helix-turn-helix domain-containing protein n=1 Tax=Streptomyces hydrogenans TaxID=1873719 RepID=UPI0036352C79
MSMRNHPTNQNFTRSCQAERLTPREVDVVSLIALGYETERCAKELSISPHTVTHHLRGIFRRTMTRNRTELVSLLYAAGVFRPGIWPPAVSEDACLAWISRVDGALDGGAS